MMCGQAEEIWKDVAYGTENNHWEKCITAGFQFKWILSFFSPLLKTNTWSICIAAELAKGC